MKFESLKGIIALDIDGTVTQESHTMASQVADYLTSLAKDDWKIIFITGRPFQWSYQTLKDLSFTYILAVQNGSLLIQLPEMEIVVRKYLSKDIIPRMNDICERFDTDYIIYSGLENDDICYYRPKRMSHSLLDYVKRRSSTLNEIYQAVESFHDLPITVFSSVKCFADEPQAFALSQEMEELGLHAPPNRDPFDRRYFVIQGTHGDATKGLALKNYAKHFCGHLPIIAAGDDYNDLTMLEVADIKIVMANGPQELIKMADVVAPEAKQNGIITGLEEAIQKVRELKK